jgi:signal transduction histidine kinase
MPEVVHPDKFAFISAIFRWRTYFLYSTSAIPAVLLRIPTADLSIRSITGALLTGVLVALIILPILWIGFSAVETLIKRKIAYRFSFFLLLGLFGAIRGYAIHLILPIFETTDSYTLSKSIISSTIFTLLFYCLASFISQILIMPTEIFQKEFSRATLARVNNTRPFDDTLTESEYLDSMQTIKKKVSKHLPTNTLINPSQLEILSASREIQNQIDLIVRPFSQRLWIGSFGEMKSIGMTHSLREAITNPQFSKNYLIGFQFFIGVIGISLATNSLGIGFVRSFFGTLTTAIVLTVFTYLRGERERISRGLGALFLLAIGITPVLVGSLSTRTPITSWDLIGAIIVSPIIPVVVIASSLYRLILEDKRFAITVARSVRIAQQNFVSKDSKSSVDFNLAGYLHNSLQSDLLRISKHLEKSSNENVGEAVSHLDELSSILDRSLEDISRLRIQGLKRLAAVAESWTGIAEIQLEIVEPLTLPKEKEGSLVSMLEEMITNSVRHGAASIIKIKVANDADIIIVKISHDGNEMNAKGEGLGTKWINQYSDLKPTAQSEGNILTFTLTI